MKELQEVNVKLPVTNCSYVRSFLQILDFSPLETTVYHSQKYYLLFPKYYN